MKTALLICDEVNEDLRKIHGDYDQMYDQLFPELQLSHHKVFKGDFPSSVEDYEAYIVNGSRKSVYDAIVWIDQLKQFTRDIQQAGKKYLGICFGHQMLAEALGGKVAKSDGGWCVGVHDFEMISYPHWMRPVQSHIQLLMMCQDQVQVMPSNSRLLASSQPCPIAMFQVGDNMLGVQAHPEFSKAYDQALMELRVERMGKEVVDEGIRSLQKRVDRDIIRDWSLGFLG